MAVFWNDQTGILSAPVISPATIGASGGAESLKFEIMDLNTDGELDLLYSHIEGEIELMLGNGDGTFVSEVIISDLADGKAADVGDIDGDLDIVVVNFGYLSVFLNDGTCSFSHYGDYGEMPKYSTVGSLALHDFNTKGRNK